MRYKRVLFIIVVFIFCGITAYAKSDGYIVKFKSTPHNLDTSLFEEIHAETGVYYVKNTDCLYGYEDIIEYVEKNEEVELILPEEPIQEVGLMSLPDDDLYSSQWSVQMVNADYAWQHEAYGNDVRVAVLDSGCYPHLDLADNLLPGKNFLDNSSDTYDDHGHGTHVSGIIAAGINSAGTVGVAPKAKIIPIKCFSATENPSRTTLISCIYSAVDDFDCKIINMSWGLSKNTTAFQAALDYACNKGVILIASVGNAGNSTLYYPAASENVIGVGSVDKNKAKSYFSQKNSSVFITAPGSTIFSTSNTGSYVYMDGTSQAAPHIAGIAALALSIDNSLTPDRFASLLSETAEDLGTIGYDTTFGYGLANVQTLIDKLLEDTPYYVSPINFQGDKSYVLIKNNTDSILSAQSIFAGFSNGRLCNCSKTDITVIPGKSVITKADITHNPSHFLWTNLKSSIPLADKR